MTLTQGATVRRYVLVAHGNDSMAAPGARATLNAVAYARGRAILQRIGFIFDVRLHRTEQSLL